MYHSLMKQVVHFLERARKSLNILHVTNNNNKNSTRNNRNQNVCMEESSKSLTEFSNSTSRLNQSESITEISRGRSDIQNFTCFMMNNNSFSHQNPPLDVNFQTLSQEFINKTKYQRIRHKSTSDCSEINFTSDHIPPEKLSQEAFRLMKIIESLLAMRESHLSVVSSSFSSATSSSTVSSTSPSSLSSSMSPTSLYNTSSTAPIANNEDNRFISSIDCDISHQDDAIINSTRLYQDNSHHECCDNLNSNRIDIDNSFDFNKIRNSEDILIDSTAGSRNSSSSSSDNSSNITYPTYLIASNVENFNRKTKEIVKNNGRVINSVLKQTLGVVSSSTPNQKVIFTKLMEEEESNMADKLVTSVENNVEDESGISSRNSFHDVGLPVGPTLDSSINSGRHSQIGLPELSLDRINHRRWSSTPAEIQNLFKKYKNGFVPHQNNNVESLSVWV
ncbi:hypothetical protein PV327_003070 [Microctonus hyperodae]|uniref:Uncharacterized protein n=1 Tax=Microctonus hyperodae TaxID=165561 RepID=A0AA39L0M6_MICHY|nr:hypothetical protein PV327_003070 [Microctonus hyperodae]